MKLRMAENSLFAILLRSPWWVSFAAAFALFAGLRLAVPELYAAFFALPFIVIGGVAAWKQLRAPSAAALERSRSRVAAMTWDEFAAALGGHYTREGYAVTRIAGADADLEMTRSGRTCLVACKRWKAGRTGVEPLRALHAAAKKRDASECVYVAAGEITDTARDFALRHNVRLVDGDALARLRL